MNIHSCPLLCYRDVNPPQRCVPPLCYVERSDRPAEHPVPGPHPVHARSPRPGPATQHPVSAHVGICQLPSQAAVQLVHLAARPTQHANVLLAIKEGL